MVFHNKMVLAFWYGVDDEIEDSGNHFHNKMVLAFQYGDDDERGC